MNEWARSYAAFSRGVLQRLQVGALEYEDKSFDLDPDDLVGEIMAEIEDSMGWSFLLWCRLRKIREKIEEVKR